MDIRLRKEKWFTIRKRTFGFEIGFFMFGKPKWWEKYRR